ncbi:MAG: cyclodeaminase/cyclohydrolase family protein [Planctomycetota bacterium]|nr:cyclodeaminase/cyclohydrolase family protein [Planctomycetota bacterium]
MNLSPQPFSDILDAVASKTPTPGGGAVTGCVAALAAALAQMVVSFSLNKRDLAAHQPTLEAAAAQLERARKLLLELAAEDMAAYETLNAAFKIPKDDPARPQALQAAARQAVQPPLATIAACADLLRLYETLAGITNRQLRSDLAIAAILTEAVARASRWNISINAPLLAPDDAHQARERTAEMLTVAEARARGIEAACA